VTKDEIGKIFMECFLEVLPELASKSITTEDSMRDLGANSVDRAEIIMLTLARLKLKIPMVNFAKARNIGELIDTFCHHLAPVT
jgi:polyketide biosynthesis acyl carrier protein